MTQHHTTLSLLMPKKAHQLVNQDSGNSEWFTPPEIIEAAREVMGSIDLDPASCEAANALVGAKVFITKQQNGLATEWHGPNVWLNWPFSKGENTGNTVWSQKLCLEWTRGVMQQCCTICFASTSEQWFQWLAKHPQCYLKGRTNYLDPVTLKPVKGVTKGSVVTYLGPNISCFAQVFSKLGTVKVVYS